MDIKNVNNILKTIGKKPAIKPVAANSKPDVASLKARVAQARKLSAKLVALEAELSRISIS